MKDQRILNYGRHLIDEDDIEAVVSVLRGDLITQGPVVERFEAALAEKVGARHAVSVSSGTAALHIACLAAGMKPGDVGVTSALTFVASANAMRYCGADVKLTDIDPQTLCMSPSFLETTLREVPEISVVIPVHFAGLPADAAAIRRIAGNRVVIEDAAHAFGSTYDNGRPVGCGDHSDMTVFSFHPVKPITTGEGGAVLTNDDELAHRLRIFRMHGLERDVERFENEDEAYDNGVRKPWYYEQQDLGFNYRLTDIQAALGLSQMSKLDRFIKRRREIALRYDQAFENLAGVSICQNNPEQRSISGHHLYVVKLDSKILGGSRTELIGRLKAKGVGSQVHYIPVYRQPYYERYLDMGPNAFPETEAYYRDTLSLPLFPDMTDDEVAYVIDAIQGLKCA